MVADFSIRNNTHSSGQRNRETLRRLTKEIFENADKKERSVDRVMPQYEDYTTKTYIPAETYICNISSRAFTNNNLQQTLNFLNNKAAIKSFTKDALIDIPDAAAEKQDLFDFTLDESKNIFAA